MDSRILLVLAGIAILFLVLDRKRLFAPNLQLDWETLRTLMRDRTLVNKFDISDRNEYPGASVQAQFRWGDDSVKYFRTTHSHSRTETLDVYRPNAFGFVVTFQDEVPSLFQRVGGRTRKNPEFTLPQRTALIELLRRFRSYADEP
jgi:hypothetical protein